MHAAFGTVVVIVCIVALVIALVALMRSGRTWSELGRGGLVMDHDPAPRSTAMSGPAPAAEREADIRDLVEARNRRRERRGEAPVDVEEEVARLLRGGEVAPSREAAAGAPETSAPPPATGLGSDPELREEIRQLVVARNHRRVRSGKPPLDVEAEVERELRRLSEL